MSIIQTGPAPPWDQLDPAQRARVQGTCTRRPQVALFDHAAAWLRRHLSRGRA